MQAKEILKPSKEEQRAAIDSYAALASTLSKLNNEFPEIEIEETQERIKIPLSALKVLAKLLKSMSLGKPVSLVPLATELTTQAAAELLGCSRPHFVKLLEDGKIPFIKVGRHRRVKFEDVMEYKKQSKQRQKDIIIKMMQDDENLGLYDL